MTPEALMERPSPHAAVGRFSAAFEAVESLPALADSRDRLLQAVAQERVSAGEVVTAVESDVALTIAVLRRANERDRPVESVVEAVELLAPAELEALALRVPTFDLLEDVTPWDAAAGRFRLHALATQRAAHRLAIEAGYAAPDRLLVTALLHDIGKLVLTHAELDGDHALVGGELARRWGLPDAIVRAIERHHAEAASGEAAYVRLADMLAHYAQGAAVPLTDLLNAAQAIGLEPAELRTVVYDLPYPQNRRVRAIDSCPLSERELEVLKQLAQSKVYKQIAFELHLSASTVRTHLHNVYRKLGAVDRAQAVLLAADRGWL